METKKCTKCKILLSIDKFYFQPGRNSYTARCKECLLLWRRNNVDKVKGYGKKWRINNLEYFRKYKVEHREENSRRHKSYRVKSKLQVLNYYSGNNIKCQCCGEMNLEFMTVDHIEGNGSEHRKEMRKNGIHIHNWLIKNNFPSGFRVLCFNCNCSMGSFGYCPHNKKI